MKLGDDVDRREAAVGRSVLRALDEGRAKAIATAKAQSMMLREQISRAVRIDRAAGNGERGRARRVKLLLRGIVSVSERHIRRVLAEEGHTLQHVRNSGAQLLPSQSPRSSEP